MSHPESEEPKASPASEDFEREFDEKVAAGAAYRKSEAAASELSTTGDEIARQDKAKGKRWLEQAARVVNRPPGDVTVSMYCDETYGWRVLINEGSNPYSQAHLVDYYCGSRKMRIASGSRIDRSEAARWCIEFYHEYRRQTELIGSSYTWPATGTDPSAE